MTRDPEAIQREIDRARDGLASTLDQLVERASPQRAIAKGKQGVRDFLASPKGKAVVAGAGAVVALLVARRINLAVQNHRARS